ncbi:MAG: hypothetical protein ACR2LC_09655 [Pyrinomonadaceae bacterium]
MESYGRQILTSTGRSVTVACDMDMEWKTAGITVDWSTVAAAGSDTALADDTPLKSGQKALRFGQIMTKITSVVNDSKVGYYGPYDPAATDGRQTLARGSAYILNQTQLENNLVPGLPSGASDHPAVFDGGRVWRARLLVAAIMGGGAAASLANGPTVAAFEAAFPDITYVNN